MCTGCLSAGIHMLTRAHTQAIPVRLQVEEEGIKEPLSLSLMWGFPVHALCLFTPLTKGPACREMAGHLQISNL